MADTLKKLVGVTALTTSSVALYTVGAGLTAVIRNIHIANNASSVATFNLGIGASVSSTNALYFQTSVPAYGAFDWSGFMVLAAADVLAGLGSTASQLIITVSGVESS